MHDAGKWSDETVHGFTFGSHGESTYLEFVQEKGMAGVPNRDWVQVRQILHHLLAYAEIQICQKPSSNWYGVVGPTGQVVGGPGGRFKVNTGIILVDPLSVEERKAIQETYPRRKK